MEAIVKGNHDSGERFGDKTNIQIKKSQKNGKRYYKILVIGDIGGGTEYQSDDNLIGLAYYIDHEEHKPDMLYLTGALSFRPTRGSNRSNDYLDVEKPVSQWLRDESAVIKPHLERILRSLPEDSVVIYVLGDQDARNIKELRRDMGLEFKGKHKREELEHEMLDTTEYIVSRETIIETTKVSIATLRQMIEAGDVSLKDPSGELKNAKLKLKLNKEERGEAEYRMGLINELYSIALGSSNESEIRAQFDKKVNEEKEIRKEFEDVKRGTKRYEEVASKAKKIANEIRLLSNRLDDLKQTKNIERRNKESHGVDIFTHNSITPKNEHYLIKLLAESKYISLLKDAFGRKRPVEIQTTVVTPREARIGAVHFNILTAYNLSVIPGTRKKTSNDAPEKTLNTIMVNGVIGKKTLEARPLNVLITAKNNYSSFAITPLSDMSSSQLAVLCQGPFWSTKRIAAAWNRRINTMETQTVEKTLLSSGAAVLKVSDRGFVAYQPLSEESLTLNRMKSDKEEIMNPGFTRMLKHIRDRNGDKESLLSHRKMLDKEVALSNRPSEMKVNELKAVFKNGGIDIVLPYRDADIKSAYDLEGHSIAIFSDAHIGNHTVPGLLAASIKDARERKPDLLVLNGDMLEGLYQNYALVARHGFEYNFINKYRKVLEEEGLSDSQVDRRVLKKLNDTFLAVRTNVDEQPNILMENFWSLIDEVLLGGGGIVVVSGNHYNKTNNDGTRWNRDEATMITSHITSHLSTYIPMLESERELINNFIGQELDLIKNLRTPSEAEKFGEAEKRLAEVREKLVSRIDSDLDAVRKSIGNVTMKSVAGGEYGAEQLPINDVLMMFSHEIGGTKESSVVNFVQNKMTDASLLFRGHLHETQVVYAGGKMIIETPSEQDPDQPFTNRIAVTTGTTNGYMFVKYAVDKNTGRVFSAEVVPVLQNYLLRPDPVEEKADRKLRSMRIERH